MSFQVKYIYDLVDKISPSLRKIQANTQKTANVVQSQAMKIGRSFDHIGDKMKKLGKRSAEIGRGLFLRMTLPIGLLGASFIKVASAHQEALSKSRVVFKEYSKEVERFSEKTFKTAGLGRKDALDLASFFGQLGTSMGIATGKAAEMSIVLTQFAGDVASFQDKSVEQVRTGLKGIFTGETQSIIELGVSMTETNLRAYALSKGIRKKISHMKQDEKVMLRYRYVMETLKNAQGDYIRTNSGFANSLRSLTSKYQNLGIKIGIILIPYAIKLIGVFSRLIDKFNALSPRTQKIVLIMAALAAILPPILITIGLMASGMGALVLVFGALASPIGLVTVAIVSLLATTGGLVTFFEALSGNKESINSLTELSKLLVTILTTIGKIISISASGWNTGIGAVSGFANDFLGKTMDNKGISSLWSDKNIKSSTSINQRQNFAVGGQLDINFGNMPRGTNTKFTPIPQSVMKTGTNTVYGGF